MLPRVGWRSSSIFVGLLRCGKTPCTTYCSYTVLSTVPASRLHSFETRYNHITLADVSYVFNLTDRGRVPCTGRETVKALSTPTARSDAKAGRLPSNIFPLLFYAFLGRSCLHPELHNWLASQLLPFSAPPSYPRISRPWIPTTGAKERKVRILTREPGYFV